MENSTLTLSAAIHEAFTNFTTNDSLLALPLTLTDDTLQALPPIPSAGPSATFQVSLNALTSVLHPETALYLILRRNTNLTAITFVPYLANPTQRHYFLSHRHDLTHQLGKSHISYSLICKEVVEITDTRSWLERDESTNPDPAGYVRNKCRLCDRRMQNAISPGALAALRTHVDAGALVQISLDMTTSTLTLTHAKTLVKPDHVAALLSAVSPSFTFYTHPTTQLVYFIYHSPDAATVRERMQHTLAVPGLLVHAQDAGVCVDRKSEIHDAGELEFEERDERVGRFRSMWVREGYVGTELRYEGMDRAAVV